MMDGRLETSRSDGELRGTPRYYTEDDGPFLTVKEQGAETVRKVMAMAALKSMRDVAAHNAAMETPPTAER